MNTQVIDGHEWHEQTPPRVKPRRCEVGMGMVLQMGQPRFKQCGLPSTHTLPWVTKHSRWPMAVCAKHAAAFAQIDSEKAEKVIAGEWWPRSTVVT